MTLVSVGAGSPADSPRLRAAADSAASDVALLYSDYLDAEGNRVRLIDRAEGALRDDFDFGPLIAADSSLLSEFPECPSRVDIYRLVLAASRKGRIVHIAEPLYSLEAAGSGRKSQFDYVDPRNRSVQIELEKAVTEHLDEVGALVDTSALDPVDLNEGDFGVEASVVIPVRNRHKTVGDAIRSALSQKTDFQFNVIVVDNYSTDGTTELIESIAAADSRVVHIVPAEKGHGIGGCWNIAVDSPLCGRFAVQLDSDDLYSSPDTLQRIVDTFRATGAAMVIGSYTLTDFDLNTIPPGLIDHSEWTDGNGPNNALRINGLGAPRAFFTPVIRRFGFPDVSYGEDYAAALAISGRHRIARIFDSLYLCRRWSGNSDASPTPDIVNLNNAYKDSVRTEALLSRLKLSPERLTRFFDSQISVWPVAAARYEALAAVETKTLDVGGQVFTIYHNRSRAGSTCASMTAAAIAARPCFLCDKNRPGEQTALLWEDLKLLVNPFPIHHQHFTVVAKHHQPQRLRGRERQMARLAAQLPGYTVFFNGARCGASAPDHFHFQIVKNAVINWGYQPRALRLTTPEGVAAIGNDEMLNVMARSVDGNVEFLVFRRTAHRPKCYPEMRVSPASLDLAGSVITPVKADFERIDSATLAGILQETCPVVETPTLRVGIVTASRLDIDFITPFRDLSGRLYRGPHTFEAAEIAEPLVLTPLIGFPSRFAIARVPIGIDFHWHRIERQIFTGSLTIAGDGNGGITAINVVSVEDYLKSVVSSEMSADAHPQLLRAHAVISRSWVLAQLESGRAPALPDDRRDDDGEIVRWYDRSQHTRFDVCADDHCQRYQGLSRIGNAAAVEAVEATRGMVLTSGGKLCDARFSKCCGGVFERFSNCWNPVDYDYLRPLRDSADETDVPDLTREEEARRWILGSPDAYCNTADIPALDAALNAYDRETPDFFRWTVSYEVDELSELVRRRSGIDFGTITAIEPLQRGESGRIVRLRVTGTRRRLVVGKELEIRRWLSESHLKSSAFIVDRDADGRFIFHGAGWGHGVGLCQIGAAMMANEGIPFRRILSHYYPGSEIERRY